MIILHVGAPKTGSTAIQDFLHTARSDLEAAGLVVPDIGWAKGRGHFGVRQSMNKNSDGVPEMEAVREDLKRSFIGEDRAILISTETLWTVPPQAMLRVYPELKQAHVVLYLREQSTMIASHFSQKIKGGINIPSLSEYIDQNKHQYDFDGILKEWQSAVGRSNVHPFIYEDAAPGGGLVAHFIRAVADLAGIDVAKVNRIIELREADTKKIANRRTPPVVIAMLMVINKSNIPEHEKANMRRLVMDELPILNELQMPDSVVSDKMSETIRSLYMESNAKLHREWFPHLNRKSLFITAEEANS